MTHLHLRLAAIAVAVVSIGSACSGRSATDDEPSKVLREPPPMDRGGASLAIATSVPQALNTPLSVPPSRPGVSVTIPPEAPCTIVAQISNTTLGFAYDSMVLSADGEAALRAFVGEVLRNGHRLDRAELLGFASSEGTADHNMRLSRGRAGAVAAVLATIEELKGAPVKHDGRGEEGPIGDNETEEGREANRRVEATFHFTGCG